jgi:Na+-transporting methylmalonyl-CoA/oxaloacetate decarboxylase gamma subunit
MATIVNNPPASDNSGGPMGMIIVLVVLLILGYLAYVYGLPAVRQMQGGTQINVPSKIDVNVKQAK